MKYDVCFFVREGIEAKVDVCAFDNTSAGIFIYAASMQEAVELLQQGEQDTIDAMMTWTAEESEPAEEPKPEEQVGMFISEQDVGKILNVYREERDELNSHVLVPMSVDDLENWEKAFSMTMYGIEDHLTDSVPDKEYVIGALLGMDRQLQVIIEDMRKRAQLAAKLSLTVRDVFM